ADYEHVSEVSLVGVRLASCRKQLEVAGGQHVFVQVAVFGDELSGRADGGHSNGALAEIGKDQRRLGRGEGNHRVSAHHQFALLDRVLTVGIGAGRNVHREYPTFEAVDDRYRVGGESLQRWLETRAKNRIQDQLCLERLFQTRLCKIFGHTNPKGFGSQLL